MHKTPLLIIILCLIFEILSCKVTSVSLCDIRYIELYGKGANAKLVFKMDIQETVVKC